MSSSPERFAEQDDTREPRTDRPQALTPLPESARGDGYSSASLDVTDLDPPTWFPPN
jgi:hypothetical protein